MLLDAEKARAVNLGRRQFQENTLVSRDANVLVPLRILNAGCFLSHDAGLDFALLASLESLSPGRVQLF